MSSSLQATAEAYLRSSAPQYSRERQILIGMGKTCIMPLLHATLETIVSDYNTAYDQFVKRYIDYDFDVVTAIGQDAFDVLYQTLRDPNDNLVLVAALIVLEETKPSDKTLRAISTVREPLWKKREKTGRFARTIDSTLWWIYCFILFHSHSDPRYDQHLLETLQQVGYQDPIDGLNGIKQESYRVLLNNLIN